MGALGVRVVVVVVVEAKVVGEVVAVVGRWRKVSEIAFGRV